jgi:hypothetical protein
MSRKLLLVLAVVLAVAGLSTGIALATSGGDGGDGDTPLTGAALEQATEAALAHAGGGTVIETEVGDDGAAYSVEIQLGDGRIVEIDLDEDFQVIGREADEDGANEHEDRDG